MQRLLSITLITIAAEHVYAQRDREHQGPQTCGGHLKAPVGTITTPNFPNPFPVPIKCKWIIEHDIVNGTISIYFTQQYTTSGLTFTEYMYYDESYKLGERRALTVTEENITRIKWLQVQSPVLVVELNLNRLEGTQLRALGLLSVFGFNMTYEVRGPAQSPGPTSCSAIECRLLGHCYATQDYQEFYCSCFEGYSGVDCGVGPLCPRTSNMCKNGGTCRQLGPAAVSCICAHGYTGDLCEAQLAPPECGIEECAEVCKEGTACDCNPKDTDLSSARFKTRLDIVNQPSVNISQEIITQTLVVNQRPDIWEGSEFILTCMAYGSPNIAFTWYKDGVKINFNGTTRDIWTRTVSEDALGRRMSVLGVSEAKRPDSGKWSCAANDAGRRRCRALRLTVLTPPDIRLVPSSLTVNKGDNVSVTCLAGAGRAHGALGFSWARERTLLPMAPGRELWQDLYPAGSLLKLYNVQKSSEYRCQVSSVAGTNTKAVTVWVLGADDDACESDASHGLRWPNTAPGAHATASCPPGYTGEITRFCEPKSEQHGVKWKLPDFSKCVADSLQDIFEQFRLISWGYSLQSVCALWRQYGGALRSLAPLPGAGAPPLSHAQHVLHYLRSAAAPPPDTRRSAPQLLHIYDALLAQPDAFLDEQKIFELQNAVSDTAGMTSDFDTSYHEFTIKTKPVREDNSAHFDLQPAPVGAEEWIVTSAGVELVDRHGDISVVIVLYHNLGARLPSLRRAIEFKSGRATEYTVASQQVQVSVSGAGVDATLPHTVTLLFAHSKNYSAIASKLACGVRTLSDPGKWSTAACEVRTPEHTHAACHCRGLGTYALLTVNKSKQTDSEEDLDGIVKISASLGGAMCLVAALLQLLGLTPGSKSKLPVLLKAATAGAHSVAMLALLECDTRQEEACPGVLGWVCAVSWCVGSAALCAQPLLLYAELAGRKQRAPSVGLLAGVCVVSLLSARVCGGAPLQAGARAGAVCAACVALLAALTLALALCAAAARRTISRKLPHRGALGGRAVLRHALVLLCSTAAAQAAGVAYAQPRQRSMPRQAALAVAALANGISMLVCYVVCDEECLSAARRLLALSSHSEWQHSPAGDTELSLYIKQGGEVENHGGVECSSPAASPPECYWRARPVESPARMCRRQSNPDCRADIVQCVEYKQILHPYETHAVCDLIPAGYAECATPPHPYMSQVCVELRVLPASTHDAHAQASLLSRARDTQSYSREMADTPEESCTICVQSTPDVSVPAAAPRKSCLKKHSPQLSWSTSLPSIHHPHTHSTHAQPDHAHTDRVLHKISHDLDFLLNRTQASEDCTDHIEEAAT